MNLINGIILPFSAALFFSMVLTPAVFGQTGISVAEERCSCTCADYLVEKDTQECQARCTTGWEERQCAVSAMP